MGTSFLSEPFLRFLMEQHVPVSIFLVNGIKLIGTIDAFDDKTILLKDNIVQMIFINSISTVVPSRVIDLKLINNSLDN